MVDFGVVFGRLYVCKIGCFFERKGLRRKPVWHMNGKLVKVEEFLCTWARVRRATESFAARRRLVRLLLFHINDTYVFVCFFVSERFLNVCRTDAAVAPMRRCRADVTIVWACASPSAPPSSVRVFRCFLVPLHDSLLLLFSSVSVCCSVYCASCRYLFRAYDSHASFASCSSSWFSPFIVFVGFGLLLCILCVLPLFVSNLWFSCFLRFVSNTQIHRKYACVLWHLRVQPCASKALKKLDLVKHFVFEQFDLRSVKSTLYKKNYLLETL